MIYDQTTDISQSVNLIYDQTTDISQSVIQISESVNNIQVDTGSIAYAVWSASLTPFTSSTDTAGGTLYEVGQSLSVSGSSPAAIADAVWDELLAGHQTSGSAGAELDKMRIAIGLLQSNFKMFNQIYDANNNMTSATVRIYPTPVDEAADTNHIKQYLVTATYDANGNLIDYNSVEG